jgi:hypothetical protein
MSEDLLLLLDPVFLFILSIRNTLLARCATVAIGLNKDFQLKEFIMCELHGYSDCYWIKKLRLLVKMKSLDLFLELIIGSACMPLLT